MVNNFEQAVAAYKRNHKVLTLIMKDKYFKEILSGAKTQEFREIKPSTEKKYIKFGADGFPLEDERGNAVPIEYDAILMYVGYNTDRDAMLIECKGATSEVQFDEEGEPIFYFYSYKRKGLVQEVDTYDPETGDAYDINGKQIEDAVMYYVEMMTYDLGKILAKNIH